MASEEHLRDASYRATDFDPRAAADPPARARAVVVGGGIIGASVALHLARLGWADTVVLERGRVAGGTTWHAAGLMTRTRATHMQTELASYSRDFYRDLAALSGVDVGYWPNGSLSVARTPQRLTELRYALTLAHHHGLPARELAREEIAGVSPLLAVGDLAGGVLFEEDATVNPGWAAFATARAAHDLGVRFVEGVRVAGFLLDRTAAGPARVKGVRTDRGDLECDVVVLAAGLWTHDLALLAGARVPLHPAEHYWAQTEPVDGATRDLPIIRDLDGSIYVRHYRGGLLVGAFEPDGRPRTAASIPEDFMFGEFAPDLEHFGRPLARARERVPALERARFAHYLCAPESFTPDGNFVLGETGEVAGLFVAAGMNSQGIILGPGVGRALATWIDEGAPTVDAADVDVRRFSPAQSNAGYLFERTRESLGRLYALHWPFLQPGTARGLRRVPLYERLADAGAVFGEAAGWERAEWYAPPGSATGVRVLLRSPELVRGGGGGAPRSARRSRALRPLVVRQAAGGRAGRARHGAARLHGGPRPPAGQVVYVVHAELPRRPRARRDRDTAGRALVPARHLGHGAGPRVPLAAPPRGPGRRRHGRHLWLRRALSDGPALARAARGPDRSGPERPGVPLRTRPGDRPGLGVGAGRAGLLHRRARLGAVHAGRVAARSLRPAGGGRGGARPAPCRLPRPRRAARREGLHPLGRRRRAGRHAATRPASP